MMKKKLLMVLSAYLRLEMIFVRQITLVLLTRITTTAAREFPPVIGSSTLCPHMDIRFGFDEVWLYAPGKKIIWQDTVIWIWIVYWLDVYLTILLVCYAPKKKSGKTLSVIQTIYKGGRSEDAFLNIHIWIVYWLDVYQTIFQQEKCWV